MTTKTPDRPRYPDILCIGAQKAGTTWLHLTLGTHPGVWMTPCKEVHFFDSYSSPATEKWYRFRQDQYAAFLVREKHRKRDLERSRWWSRLISVRIPDENWYASLFQNVDKSILAGETTPTYAVLPRADVERIGALIPDAKIIFVMRNPVDRAWSGALLTLRSEIKANAVLKDEQFLEVIHSAHNRQRSDYRNTIETWESVFPRDQLLYLFYDDIQEDKEFVLREACDFLGLPFSPDYFPNRDRHPNKSPPIMMDDMIRSTLAKLHYEQLVWLAATFGGHAEKWRSEVEQYTGFSPG